MPSASLSARTPLQPFSHPCTGLSSRQDLRRSSASRWSDPFSPRSQTLNCPVGIESNHSQVSGGWDGEGCRHSSALRPHAGIPNTPLSTWEPPAWSKEMPHWGPGVTSPSNHRVPEFARAGKGGVGSKTALASCRTEKGCEDPKVLTLGKPGLYYGPRKKALYLLWASSTQRRWEVKLAHRVVWRALPRNPAPLCTGWALSSW